MFNRVLTVAFLTLALLPVLGVSDAQAATAKLSEMITGFTGSLKSFRDVIAVFSYSAGPIFLVRGIMKMKDHMMNEVQTPASEPIKNMFAGTFLFSLPTVIKTVRASLFPEAATNMSLVGSVSGGTGRSGLDQMMLNLVGDIYGPMTKMVVAFGYLGGIVFFVIGILRLTKRMEDGPRGPGGIGTIMCFIAGSALFSSGKMLAMISTTLFGDATAGGLAIKANLVDEGAAEINNVIRGILAFTSLVGVIAFIRGWFVLKSFADGNQSATLAQGLTFILGGAVAVNLGDFVRVLSNTLGITGVFG